MAKRIGRLHRATALVPLAVLSVAWTASIAGVSVPTTVSSPLADSSLPDGTSVPTQAIEAPASVSDGSLPGSGTSSTADAQQIIATASTSGIPSAALAAYQRAETVINSADSSCQLPWELVAAIGRVESNHGRANGNTLDDSGVAQPGIYGIALNGSNRTAEIVDTDAGQYDNDAQYDRAVGPMQFIPSTWSVVGVDADGDGVRNPQDVDDAALGTAVYLCSGEDDLGTDAGRRAAVFRYNHSDSYVDLVLAIMDAYMDGDFTSVPNSTVMAGTLTQDPPQLPVPNAPTGNLTVVPPNNGNNNDDDNEVDETQTQPNTGPTTQQQPTQQPTTQGPQNNGNNGGNDNGNGNGNNGNGGNNGGVTVPNTPVTIPPLPTTSIEPVDGVLTLAQATVQCTLDGLNQLLNPGAFNQCLENYTS